MITKSLVYLSFFNFDFFTIISCLFYPQSSFYQILLLLFSFMNSFNYILCYILIIFLSPRLLSITYIFWIILRLNLEHPRIERKRGRSVSVKPSQKKKQEGFFYKLSGKCYKVPLCTFIHEKKKIIYKQKEPMNIDLHSRKEARRSYRISSGHSLL